MNTTENNKLIAEFMHVDGSHLWTNKTTLTNGKGYWVSQEFQGIEYPDGNDVLFPHEMKFHASWDWLMPVVEKILNKGYTLQGVNLTQKIRLHLSTPHLLHTYNAVVEFINWYNNKQDDNRNN
jgi:hypothetical protein